MFKKIITIGVLFLLFLSFQNCAEPFHSKTVNKAYSINLENDHLNEGKPLELSHLYMASPTSRALSSDITPYITGRLNIDRSGYTVNVYLEDSCSGVIGNGDIINGAFSLANIKIDVDQINTKDIAFFARVINLKSSDQTECIPLNLGYTLKTDISSSKTKRYRLMWREDPSTTMVIGWENIYSQSDFKNLYYDVEDYGRDISSYRYKTNQSIQKTAYDMKNMFVRLKDLKPNTVYYFVIEDRSGVSERFSFKTASDDPNVRISIIAGGDSRNNRSPRVKANTLVKKLRPDFVYFGGDMTNSDTSSEWKDWLDDWQNTIGNDHRITPLVAARGNHERSNEVLEQLLDTPLNVYYALSFGGNLLRAYVLNTEISESGNQKNWLESDLDKENDHIWKTAIYHKPMRPHVSSKRENNNAYNSWADLFYEYKVRLVVESDSHSVKTTWPIRPSSNGDEGFIIDKVSGTVYIGEGCWGAPLRTANDGKDWTRSKGSFNQIKWIFLDKNKIEIRTVKVDSSDDSSMLNDSNRFQIPNGISLWSPSSGSVVTIQK